MKDTDFNLAKNIKETQTTKEKEAEIIIDEYDEEDDYEEQTSSYNQPNMKDQMTKFAFVIIGGIVIVVLLIIIVLSLINRSYTYEEIETIMNKIDLLKQDISISTFLMDKFDCLNKKNQKKIGILKK